MVLSALVRLSLCYYELELMCLLLCCVQEEIEVKKDTERQDEIKAMKLAWEAAEPGRAAKVVHASLKKKFEISVSTLRMFSRSMMIF